MIVRRVSILKLYTTNVLQHTLFYYEGIGRYRDAIIAKLQLQLSWAEIAILSQVGGTYSTLLPPKPYTLLPEWYGKVLPSLAEC